MNEYIHYLAFWLLIMLSLLYSSVAVLLDELLGLCFYQMHSKAISSQAWSKRQESQNQCQEKEYRKQTFANCF